VGKPPRATGVEEEDVQKAELPVLLDTWGYPEWRRRKKSA